MVDNVVDENEKTYKPTNGGEALREGVALVETAWDLLTAERKRVVH